MLVNDVVVNSDFIAKPVEQIIYCGKQSAVYSLYKIDKEEDAEYFRGKLVVPAMAPRRVVIAKALAKIQERADAMH